MGSGVKSPCVHFYKDGEKTKEYVGDSYPALEVSLSTRPRLKVMLTSCIGTQRALGAFIKA